MLLLPLLPLLLPCSWARSQATSFLPTPKPTHLLSLGDSYLPHSPPSPADPLLSYLPPSPPFQLQPHQSARLDSYSGDDSYGAPLAPPLAYAPIPVYNPSPAYYDYDTSGTGYGAPLAPVVEYPEYTTTFVEPETTAATTTTTTTTTAPEPELIMEPINTVILLGMLALFLWPRYLTVDAANPGGVGGFDLQIPFRADDRTALRTNKKRNRIQQKKALEEKTQKEKEKKKKNGEEEKVNNVNVTVEEETTKAEDEKETAEDEKAENKLEEIVLLEDLAENEVAELRLLEEGEQKFGQHCDAAQPLTLFSRLKRLLWTPKC